MAGETTSTNMNMPIPGVGVTDGPQWAADIVSSLTIVDAHDHSPGNGVLITPDGININRNLTFNNASATDLVRTSFTSQPSALTGTNFLTFVNGNLYVNDGSGNQIPITAAGGVAGSPGSIGSLTAPASATYSSGSKTFTWLADSGKSAAMDNGAVIIRETNVASAKGVTLASASGLVADYQLTLPAALPGSNQYVTSNSSGVLSFSSADAIGSAMTATGANAVASSRTRTVSSTVAAGGVAISSSCGLVAVGTSLSDVTNLSVTITTTGRPVWVGLVSDGTGGSDYAMFNVFQSSVTFCALIVNIVRDSTEISRVLIQPTVDTSATENTIGLAIPGTALHHVDTGVNGSASTYTYKVQAQKNVAGATATVGYMKLVAYEL
jgi:hypothetical protein